MLVSLALMQSCMFSQEEEAPVALSVDTNSLAFSSGVTTTRSTTGETRSLTVTCGSKWDVASMPEWINLESIYRSGLSPYGWTVSFSANINNEYNREGKIVISSMTDRVEILASQYGPKGEYVAVESISLPSSELTITEGESALLTGEITPSNASVKDVTWKSSNTSVATVSRSGQIDAIAEGTTLITATTVDGNKTASCTVTVKAKIISVTGVSLDKTSLNMEVGDTQILTPTVTPSKATDKSVTWTSSNTSVASVSSSGVVTAKASGSATITVTTNDGGKKATCSVTVIVPVTGISLNQTSLSMEVGETKTLTATVTPSNATDKTVTWSSSNTSVATVSSAGVVTAKAAGSATITVATAEGSKKATCSVTVTVPVTGVSLNKTSLTMGVGDTETLSATVTPSNAVDKTVTWSSSNTSVATVSSSGVITAKSVGSTTITVTTNDGAHKATCSVTVIVPVTSVGLSQTSLSMKIGDTKTLIATVYPSNATDKTVTWSSSNTSVATVSSTGVVTAKASGSATITVTSNNGAKSAICSVTVIVPVTGVSLNNTSLTMGVGDTQTLTATVTPSNATDKAVFWSSSNTSVATVSSTGVVTAKAAGSATINVTTNDGAYKATCSVTVIVPVTGVSLNQTSLSMEVGDTQTLTTTVTPSNATDKTVTWSSSNTSVATVSSSGVVTAKAAGSATITVTTNDGAKKATCAVTVRVPVTAVSLDITSMAMKVGDTQTLTATVTPSNATDKTVTWSSSNSSVATVTSSGVVTAKSVGSATIVVKTTDGGKTATCSVTVSPVSVTGVTLNKYSLSMYENDTETLIATVSPSNATNKTVSWSSSNSAVVIVSSSGQVSAIAAGNAVITVTTEDGQKTATCSVNVQSDPYGAVDLGLSVKWASFNYGASSVTSTGGYYMWGDPSGSGVAMQYTPPSVNNISGTQYDIVRKNWGGNWRIPTRSEINELYSSCTWTSTTVNGVSVLKVTGRNGASIYLPFTGCAFPDDGPIGTISITDSSNAYMMSSESYGDSYGRFAYVFYFTPSGSRSSVSYNASFIKFPIRPVR